MTYQRILGRNGLYGDYQRPPEYHSATSQRQNEMRQKVLAAGDLRRLERDQRDENHLEKYALLAGIAIFQVKVVLDAFFEGDF